MKKTVFLLLIVTVGYVIPANHIIPVAGASTTDWNPASFWYSPWGRSGTHKGIDIFAKEGAAVLAATNGVVVYTGFNDMGGNIVLVLGPKWRFYYYAHLQRIDTGILRQVSTGDIIGAVGSTGNAKGKPPHLHFAVRSLLPLFWQYDASKAQAWNKIFYLDPGALLT
ncbi:M23 family metallopeptidase [Methylobacter sp.]|uniref:M23 family metallopeptidase n=1 Tax=Methylobacter sp. TaxID=2051955 RepID=UPI0025FCCCFA|nr:M23 family metallopeptidase [Methylobacter sp.]